MNIFRDFSRFFILVLAQILFISPLMAAGTPSLQRAGSPAVIYPVPIANAEVERYKKYLNSRLDGPDWNTLVGYSNSDDAVVYYALSYALDGIMSAYEATNDGRLLNKLWPLTKNMIAKWPWDKNNGIGTIYRLQGVSPIARAAYIFKKAGWTDQSARCAKFGQARINEWEKAGINVAHFTRDTWIDKADHYALINLYIYKTTGDKDDLTRAIRLGTHFSKNVMTVKNGVASWKTKNGFPANNNLSILLPYLTKEQKAAVSKNQPVVLSSAQRAKLSSIMPLVMDVNHANRQPQLMAEYDFLKLTSYGKKIFSDAQLAATVKKFNSVIAVKGGLYPLFHSYFDGEKRANVITQDGNLHANGRLPDGFYGMTYFGWVRMSIYSKETYDISKKLFDTIKDLPNGTGSTMCVKRNNNIYSKIALSGQLMRAAAYSRW